MSPSLIHPPSTTIRRALLSWFRRNARLLPWRKAKDPYRVWVSEVMLQQTQIATVIPYYRRFLRAFPTIRHLAGAPLERVLELWSGLGYYRRARYLHLAAQDVVEKFEGRFPRDFDDVLSLPGIGRYTAGAVLSIAWNQPYTVLDGNVARVLARLEALQGSLQQSDFRRTVEDHLERLLSRRSPGDFNQALMELGQTVCLPRAPRCPACPLRGSCRAYSAGNPEAYPAPRPRRATESQHLATAILRRGRRGKARRNREADDDVALIRGLDDGLLTDLWNFPGAFGNSRAEAFARLQEKLAGLVQRPIRWGEQSAEVRHGITYRAISVEIYPARISDSNDHALRWFRVADLSRAAVSQLTRKIAASGA